MPITEKMELWSFLLAVLEISIAVPVTISTLRAHFGKKGGGVEVIAVPGTFSTKGHIFRESGVVICFWVRE